MAINADPVSFFPPKPPFETVMVTGAAGFIGSRVLGILSALGCRIIAVDNGYVGLPLPANSKDIVAVNVDIRDRAAIRQVFLDHRPQAVIHLAAVHHIPTCERDPHLAFDVNVMGTQCLLEAAEAAGTKNIVFASSGAVYVWDDGPLVEGQTALGATDVYSVTKLTNEYQINGWAKRVDARVHICRLFNVIGSGDPNGHLIPDILDQIAKTDAQPTVRLGNVKPKRDYIYVDDIASGIVSTLAFMMEGPALDVFNVCTGHELSVEQLVHVIGDVLGKDIAVESDPSRFRKVDRLQQLGHPGKLHERTGWAAAWDSRSALAAIIDKLGYASAARTTGT